MIGIGAIFQNEAPYLKEWIEFHRLVGVEKFFLLDNLSTDSFHEILKPYIECGIVDLCSWPLEHGNIQEFNEIQCLAYERILHKAKSQVKWLALIDIDEFLFSPKTDHLEEILSSFDEFGGIGVNWQVFGTSFIHRIPKGQLLIETLNSKWPVHAGTNHHIKSLVRTDRVKHCDNPHFMEYQEGYFQINTKKIRFEGKLSPTVEIDLLRINHYTLRDELYFKTQKIPRLKKWWKGIYHDFEAIYKPQSMIEDRTIHRFVSKVKDLLLADRFHAGSLFSHAAHANEE